MLILLLCFFLLVAHWLACIFYSIGEWDSDKMWLDVQHYQFDIWFDIFLLSRQFWFAQWGRVRVAVHSLRAVSAALHTHSVRWGQQDNLQNWGDIQTHLVGFFNFDINASMNTPLKYSESLKVLFLKGQEFYVFLKVLMSKLRYRHIYTGTGALTASLITFIVEGIVSLCVIPIREICSLTLGCHLSNIDNYIHIYAFKLVPPLCIDYAYWVPQCIRQNVWGVPVNLTSLYIRGQVS